MNDIAKRNAMFLFGCVVVRLVFVFVAMLAPLAVLPYLGYAALLPAAGFLTIYFAKLRKTGAETLGQPIWWNEMRPVHAALYALFALYAIQGRQFAWIFLLLDVVVGLVAFYVQREREYGGVTL